MMIQIDKEIDGICWTAAAQKWVLSFDAVLRHPGGGTGGIKSQISDDRRKDYSGMQNEKDELSASQQIDGKIADLADWRGELLGKLRSIVKAADPEIIEEWKWRGVPVWSHNGIICTGETYKSVVKMTFARGASIDDPSGLFNSSLEGNTRRAIDFHEGQPIPEDALKKLIQAAIALNTALKSAKPKSAKLTKPPKA